MASTWNARTRVLLLIAALLLAISLGRQVYRWLAYADERDDLRRLGNDLEGAALAVMRSQLLADSLHLSIRGLDSELASERLELAALERRAKGGALPPRLYDDYREELRDYNRKVELRNGGYDRWREVVARNHRAVQSYNLLADSIRGIGSRIGEPYIAIPSPAEVAVRHGLDTVSSFADTLPSTLD